VVENQRYMSPLPDLSINITRLDYLHLENAIWVAAGPIGSPTYDFDFARYFSYKRLWHNGEDKISVIGRFGVAYDYDRAYEALAQENIFLIHTLEQHWRAANLNGWYPLVENFTARSLWFDAPPPAEEVEKQFAYPVFIRGTFQTNRHKASFSVVRSREDYQRVVAEYCGHPRLRQQKFVVREFLLLRPVEPKAATEMVTPSFEFRSFWWRGELVGFGPYWNTVANYAITPFEERAAISLSKQIANCLDVPFLVVDVAQLADGRWVLIECNDGQESGYAGVSPLAMWQKIIEIERKR
jgi:hypothetical protein